MKAFGQMKAVSTTSGPVVAAKSQVIKGMTDKILKPLSKDQTGNDWDRRKYEMNGSLAYNKNFLTVKDLYGKVVTEAANMTPYRGMRLDLRSLDAAETHCKFMVNRKGKEYVAELYYPNANGAVSVSIADDHGNRKLYEVTLDSDQYNNNFGYSILKSIDQMAKSAETPDNFEEMLGGDIVGGMGGNLGPIEDTLVQPSAMVSESVDWRLEKLRKICLEAEEDDVADAPADDTVGGFSADDFSMDDVADAAAASDNMASAVPADDSGAGEPDLMTFSDAAKMMATTLAGGVVDNMAEVTADAVAHSDTPVYLSASQIKGGVQGLDQQTDESIINAFGKAMGFISSDNSMTAEAIEYGGWLGKTPLYEADEIGGGDELRLTEEKWKEVFSLLDEDYTDPEHFKEELARVLPEFYSPTGEMKNPGDMAMTNVDLPSDAYGSEEPAAPAEEPAMDAGIGDEMFGDVGSGDLFGSDTADLFNNVDVGEGGQATEPGGENVGDVDQTDLTDALSGIM